MSCFEQLCNYPLLLKKSDIPAFLHALEQDDFTYPDSTICMPNGGVTRIFRDHDEDGRTTYNHYSHGQGWRDQVPSPIDDISAYLWRHRKDINAHIRKNRNLWSGYDQHGEAFLL